MDKNTVDRITFDEEDSDFEFETKLRNSWLLWEVSEAWRVGGRISQCEIGHRWQIHLEMWDKYIL